MTDNTSRGGLKKNRHRVFFSDPGAPLGSTSFCEVGSWSYCAGLSAWSLLLSVYYILNFTSFSFVIRCHLNTLLRKVKCWDPEFGSKVFNDFCLRLRSSLGKIKAGLPDFPNVHPSPLVQFS